MSTITQAILRTSTPELNRRQHSGRSRRVCWLTKPRAPAIMAGILFNRERWQSGCCLCPPTGSGAARKPDVDADWNDRPVPNRLHPRGRAALGLSRAAARQPPWDCSTGNWPRETWDGFFYRAIWRTVRSFCSRHFEHESILRLGCLPPFARLRLD